MTEERPLRVWVDDHNEIFRLGLLACLDPPEFVRAGESRLFQPEPDLARTDILVFGLREGQLGEAVRLIGDRTTRLLAVAGGPGDELLLPAVEAGVAGVLLRSDVTPRAFVHCLRSVASGNGSVPAAVLATLVAPPSARRGSLAGELTARELDVLRLLSRGDNTREIASDLSYSEKTVKNIVHDLLVRMNCRNRAQAVALAMQRGLI